MSWCRCLRRENKDSSAQQVTAETTNGRWNRWTRHWEDSATKIKMSCRDLNPQQQNLSAPHPAVGSPSPSRCWKAAFWASMQCLVPPARWQLPATSHQGSGQPAGPPSAPGPPATPRRALVAAGTSPRLVQQSQMYLESLVEKYKSNWPETRFPKSISKILRAL